MCVQCTVLCEKFVFIQCAGRIESVIGVCTMQSETVIVVGTVYSAE